MGKRSCVATGVAILALVITAATAEVPASAAVAVSDAGSWKASMVRRLADKDARPEVRAAARRALLSRDIDAAIARFLAPGGEFESAKAIATRRTSRNADIIRRVLATTSPLTSPAVHAAAIRASRGTAGEQDEFVRTGWDEARVRDENTAAPYEKEVARQAQADRDYVAGLAAGAPGAWVRAAAGRAVRTGGDADLGEFFDYEWAGAASSDQQAYRIRVADQGLLWQARLTQLVDLARAAETAFIHAEAAAVDKARTTAAEAWHAVAGQATSAGRNWDTERLRAAEQAKSWAGVAEFAKTATTAQNWGAIAARATETRNAWADEQAWAQTQAAQWRKQLDAARAGESRVATAR